MYPRNILTLPKSKPVRENPGAMPSSTAFSAQFFSLRVDRRRKILGPFQSLPCHPSAEPVLHSVTKRRQASPLLATNR